jgi:hypothetical protein
MCSHPLFQEAGGLRVTPHGRHEQAICRDVVPYATSGQGEAGVDLNIDLVVPNAIVKDQPVLMDLGGRTASRFHLGRGRTDGDLLTADPP